MKSSQKVHAAIVLSLLTVLSFNSISQVANPYDYDALSHRTSTRFRDSIKKHWVAPSLYKDKETQKKFREMWDSRTEFLVDGINNKNFIQEKELYAYIDGIIQQLQKGNIKLIPQKPILLIDRSGSVNAYSVGGNIICVNLGLIAFSSSREEIALVLAHELAHDILKHSENSMKERAEWLTSDEYKNSLKEILDSKYERYTRLKKVMEGYTYSRTKHNRYNESEADSLAVVLLKNSQIGFDAKHFLRLDSADMQYQTPLQKNIRDYFSALDLPFEDSWIVKRSKGLSSRNYNFQKNELADSLKTHPDCKDRYEKTKSFTTQTGDGTPIPAELMNKVNKMIIWNIFDNQNLTACLYRILQQVDQRVFDEWHHFMLYNVFSGLAYADNQLSRFNAINVTSKEYISKHYYELQTMLEQMPADMLESYYKKLQAQSFWNKLPNDARNMKSLFVAIVDKESSEKVKANAAKTFASSHSTSMYCEFADHFIKK